MQLIKKIIEFIMSIFINSNFPTIIVLGNNNSDISINIEKKCDDKI